MRVSGSRRADTEAGPKPTLRNQPRVDVDLSPATHIGSLVHTAKVYIALLQLYVKCMLQDGGILAEGAIALPVTLSGGALFAS